MTDLDGFQGLVAIMDRLRGADGCPWDREQDYGTLRGYLLEECYEVAESLDRDDASSLCEELGDLLFQIVFLSRIAKEEQSFTIDDVIRGISEKMIRRHPHVFGSETADTSAEVLEKWEAIKRIEKQESGKATDGEPSLLGGIPAALPALLRAERLGTKAARVGFDWEERTQVLHKLDEELRELREAVDQGDREACREELGDVLFTLAMVARWMKVEPEAALQRANVKFARRFGDVEAELRRRGVSVREAGLPLLEELWQRAKRPGSGS